MHKARPLTGFRGCSDRQGLSHTKGAGMDWVKMLIESIALLAYIFILMHKTAKNLNNDPDFSGMKYMTGDKNSGEAEEIEF